MRQREKSSGTWELLAPRFLRLSKNARKRWPLERYLNLYAVNVVLDVGANVGAFASDLFKAGFEGRIVSFEPSRVAHEKLSVAAQGNPNWAVAAPAALGAAPGTGTLNVSENLVSSSLFPITEASVQAAPQSGYVGQETVAIRTLSDAAAPFLEASDRIFVKIDAQGSERDIIEGARAILPRTVGFLVEMSLVELYQGQELMGDTLVRMMRLGYSLFDLHAGFRDQATGQLLQAHGIFVRSEG
jgi:FkbM family methyltransferase